MTPPTNTASITSIPLLACRDNLMAQNWEATTSANLRTNVMTKINSLSSIDTVERNFLASTAF